MPSTAPSTKILRSERVDWDLLCQQIQEALLDPALPRWCRTKYNIIHAFHSDSPQAHIDLAKSGLEDMRRVLEVEGKNGDQVAERLQPLVDLLALVEDWIGELNEE